MREELKHCNSIGTKKAVLLLLGAILNKDSMSFEAINSVCSNIASSDLNIRMSLFLLEDLGVITIVNGGEELTDIGFQLASLSNSVQRVEWLINRAFDIMAKDETIDLEKVSYNHAEDCIILDKWAIPLQYAVYRNFLICMGGLVPYAGGWIIPRSFEKSFIRATEHRRVQITQKELLEKLKKQQHDGDIAEQFVMKYEEARLGNNPALKPKRISLIDVSAGYDIASYKSEQSTAYDRFIEVKSFWGKPHFFWSQNERLVARAYREKYCLFLVNMKEISKEENDYVPIVIEDPFNEIREDEWIMEPDSYKVTHL